MSDFITVFARHAHYLEQYFNGVEKKFIPLLKKVEKDLRENLLRTETVRGEKRRNELLLYVRGLIDATYTEFTDEVLAAIEELTAAEIEFTATTIKRVAELEATLPALSQTIAAVKATPFKSGRNGSIFLKDYLSDFPRRSARMIEATVASGFEQGKTTQQIITDIIGTKEFKYRDGVVQMSRTSASRMVRTALSHTASVARDEVYKDNTDIIGYYRWVSTLDGDTSDICISRDGNIYEVGKGPKPPAHFNCRSSTAPVLSEDVKVDKNKNGDRIFTLTNAGGKRASMDGPVSAKLSYGDWLAKQGKDFQDDVLGPTRAKLFREGGLSVDKFVNDKGVTLTLEQLKNKYPTAWGKIDKKG